MIGVILRGAFRHSAILMPERLPISEVGKYVSGDEAQTWSARDQRAGSPAAAVPAPRGACQVLVSATVAAPRVQIPRARSPDSWRNTGQGTRAAASSRASVPVAVGHPGQLATPIGPRSG